MTDVETQNINRIRAVEKLFSEDVNFVVPGRILVGEGVLKKICRKTVKDRKVVLFSDIIVFAQINALKKLTGAKIVALEKITLSALPDSEAHHPYGWTIRTPEKSFVVCASSEKEKEMWIKHIGHYSQLRKEATDTQESHETAAVWVSDSQAKVCMNCKKYEFSAFKRRHHCRKCGAVVCSKCSKYELILSNISTKPQRVCELCYKNSKNSSPPREKSQEQANPDDDASQTTEGENGFEFKFYND